MSGPGPKSNHSNHASPDTTTTTTKNPTPSSIDILIPPPSSPHPPTPTTDFVTPHEERDLHRGLHQRHVSLIAIAGAIGTGLFLGLGGSIQAAGPLGALLGYATVGGIVCAVQFALGEVTALLPVTGSFVRHAEFLVDPAVGFAVGWNIVSWWGE
jgi:amino acid transporter